MSAPTRDELAELRSFTVSTVNDALRLLNVKDSLLDYIAALEAQNRQLREALKQIIRLCYTIPNAGAGGQPTIYGIARAALAATEKPCK